MAILIVEVSRARLQENEAAEASFLFAMSFGRASEFSVNDLS